MDSSKFDKKCSTESESSVDKGPSVKVDALGRKVWDRNYFTDKAISKSAGGDVVEETISTLYQGTFKKPVITVPEVREDLKPRKETIDFSKYVGRMEVIDALGPRSKQGGFFCKTCNCLLKDSQTYLDHLNGRKHNRLLGMTMRVEKVDAKTVAAKLRNLANQDAVAAKTKDELENDARERIKELEMYEREMREKRKLMKKEKKKKKHQPYSLKEEDEEERRHKLVKSEPVVKSENEEYEDELSPELEAMRASGLPLSFA
ncbi:hypothetical protein MACJ_002862 [Theileria orientalis]|uniref:U1-type domain-containing protein n=1 Tax=Theileria orientalis TaxID=68886 RepID=A0A976QT03_THEOR|nr:hypothetical protein MACJ_002862 [Theileria orientalis]